MLFSQKTKIKKPSSIHKIACAITLIIGLVPLGVWGDTVSYNGLSPTQVVIPLQKNQGPDPADDLTGLSTGKAIELEKKTKLDLSTLNPAPSDVWKGPSSAADEKIDEALPINSGDLVQYDSVPNVNKPYFKVNVQALQSDGTQKTLSLTLARDLHAVLLRKELLRRLGYVVPAMKYIPKVRIKFKNRIDLDIFINNPQGFDISPHILDWTGGRPDSWCSISQQLLTREPNLPCKVNSAETDPLVIDFQDVVATEPEPLYQDVPIFNLAINPPIKQGDVTQGMSHRVYRALAVIYDLVNFPESINQADWYAGRIQNHSVTFPVPEVANFSCARDDAVWAINRISMLTRQDIEQIVAYSYFPDPIAKVIVEKIIARRNSLNALFDLRLNTMPFDPKVTDLPSVKNGKVLQKDWPGYASSFAYGDSQSPIRGLKYYFLSQLEGNAIDTLMTTVNGDIPSLDLVTQTKNHLNEITSKLSSGEITNIPMKVWVLPLIGLNLVASRGIFLGNYLGTNNLIQLADSVGFTINTGIAMGVDALPAPFGISGAVQGALGLTLTHIKPLQLLKKAITEPPKNMIVPFSFKGAAGILNAAFDLQGDKSKDPNQIREALIKDMGNLKNFLGKEESLILTESVQVAETLTGTASAQVPWSPGISVTGGPNQGIIRRIQFYRKDDSTIQVFVDNGDYLGLTLSFDFTTGAIAQFPVLTFTAKKVRGEARSKIYKVNIDPDSAGNQDYYINLKALAHTLKTGSTSFLDANKNNKPALLDVKFNDSLSTLQFFQFVRRHLKLNGQVFAQRSDGKTGDFIALTDGKQSGKNYQSLATDAGTYLIQRISGNGSYGFNTQSAPNPGHSFLGSSKTRDIDFQARENPAGLQDKYLRIQYRWEGWSSGKEQTMNVINTQMNPRYGIHFFDEQALHDTSKVQLYELTTTFNIYQDGINHLIGLSAFEEKSLATKFYKIHQCDRYPNQIDTMTGDDITSCAAIEKFKDTFDHLRKGETDVTKYSKDLLQLVDTLERFAPFQDMVNALGGDQNIFVNGEIQGYLVGSEILNDPIYSTQTIGQQLDPYNPGGPIDFAEKELDIQDGEFYVQWLRDFL